MKKYHFLLCSPQFFDVQYEINPWMQGQVGEVNRRMAQEQWDAFKLLLQNHADLSFIQPRENLPDMPFVANAGLVYNDQFISSTFRYPQRAGERESAVDWFRAHGYQIHTLSEQGTFEGEGDALFEMDRPILWCGYGFRSGLHHYCEIGSLLGVQIRPLQLVNKCFYHLDTCLALLPEHRVVYYPAAFSAESLALLRRDFPEDSRIEVEETDAMRFACNAVVTDTVYITPHASVNLRQRLQQWGYTTLETPLGQFMLAGGAAKCLVLKLDNGYETKERSRHHSEMVDARITIQGHLIDSNQLNDTLDCVGDSGCGFEVESFQPGWNRDQDSLAKIHVIAPNAEKLGQLLPKLETLGATIDGLESEAEFKPAEQSGVAPDDFYSSTIYRTEVYFRGQWIPVHQQRMDAVLVLEEGQEELAIGTKLIRDLQIGDPVLCDRKGIRVSPPSRDSRHSPGNDFEFMRGAVSSERRVESEIETLAHEMLAIRSRGGRIVVVAGPVVVHTGGGDPLASLIRDGFVQALLGGNAIAVHDIEHQLFGTSLGVDLESGETVDGGHCHHLRAINVVRRAGGLRETVRQELVSAGIFYECVKHNVPFVLAGSIRDDGPLPDTEMDLVAAQKSYGQEIADTDMILMLSSMLHSIAVGNMTPAGVPLICVDINPAVVIKLSDRGSLESRGIVTDVGLFLKTLVGTLQTPTQQEVNRHAHS